MDVENIGKFLLQLRKENNLTQKEIATLCNVSAQAVSKWERGISIPDIELLERLSVLYKTSINELISGEKKTIYIDVEKRRKIINLTAAVFAFMAYLFNFVNSSQSIEMQEWNIFYTLKGYELIFNGIGGYVVILSWFVFIILISYLIIRTYLIVKIIDYSAFLHKYLMTSMIIVMTIAFISLIVPEFYAFPQLIILISVIIQFTNSIQFNFPKSKESEMMNRYKNSFKKNDIDKKLLLNTKGFDLKLIKISKIAIKLGIVLYYLVGLVLFSTQIQNVFEPWTSGLEIMMFTLSTILIFVLATYVLKMYKYIDSFNSKKVLIQIGLMFLPILLIMTMFMETGIVGSIVGNIDFIIWIVVFLISCLSFFTAYRIHKIQA